MGEDTLFPHALYVCRHILFSHNSLRSQYYTNDVLVIAYAESIHPVGNRADLVVSNEARQIDVCIAHLDKALLLVDLGGRRGQEDKFLMSASRS